jgi:hypothetical protein
MPFELQSSLAKGISELYNNAYNLANDSLKKNCDENIRFYLSNRRYFYSAISLIKMKESLAEVFVKKGEGWGKQISYLKAALSCLIEGANQLSKISNFVNTSDYNQLKEEIEGIINEMVAKNKRIYYDSIPEVSTLQKVEKLIKVSPAAEDLENKDKCRKYEGELEPLMSKNIRPMINNYKNKLMNYISSELDKLQDESKISEFLTKLNLPYSLEALVCEDGLPETLWNNISEVQQKGSSVFLSNGLANIENRRDEVFHKISDLELMLYEEQEEDNKMRMLYSNRWTRLPSSQINKNYMDKLNDYKSKLIIAKNTDSNIKQSVLDNMRYFDLINLPKKLIESKLIKSHKNLDSEVANSEEASKLRSFLEKLNNLKEKIMEGIHNIFNKLNDDNLVPQFMLVLSKKLTENEIFDENKIKYGEIIYNLKSLSEEVTNLKNEIIEKNEAFLKLKSLKGKFSSSQENENFLSELNYSVENFNKKNFEITQGLNFYNEFFNKLEELNEKIKDFILARNFEKEDLSEAISRGQNIMMSQSDASYLDPNLNNITNMRYSYHYRPENNNP